MVYKNHAIELLTVLYNKRIDIALITETHCTKYSTIYIARYKLLKTNHPDNTAHGGVRFSCKQFYKHHSIVGLVIFKTNLSPFIFIFYPCPHS